MAVLKRTVIVLLLCLVSFPARADGTLQLAEQEIKAGLLYNFLKYTEWPVTENPASITVCVFGDDPFGEYLQPMAERTVNQRVIIIRKLNTNKDASNCQLVFINAGEKDRWPDLQRVLNGKAVLTVSDMAGFTASGGMIAFGRKDSHIRMEMSRRAVAAGGLQVEERLLKLVTVADGPGGEARP